MYKKFSNLSDPEWLQILKKSISASVIDGVRFPGFPEEDTQVLFTSGKNEDALNEAYKFYILVKKSAETFNKPIGPQTQYLDFGVGWGRIMRMFFKDLNPDNIYGVDITPEILSVCQNLMTIGTLKLSKPRGSLDFNEKTFDLVTAYSVFSHLSEDNGIHWIREIHRVIKPAGLFVITTLSSSFVQLCLDVIKNPNSSEWAQQLAISVNKSYPDHKSLLANFPKDQLLYLSIGGGFESMGSDDYGWAMVQKDFIQKQWSKYFDIIEFIDKPESLPQAYITLRRKA
jgi:ubiquinone/menaquinone biosynthesis C-methylase UbiE